MTEGAGSARGPSSLPEYVGRYRVLERIGRGAMGVVYAALDEQLDRKVAVKLMLTDFDEEPEMRERFYREARITGQLAHRNIVTVFDLGEERNRPFLVMELLEGLQLPEHLQTQKSQSLDAKIGLMLQVCDALQQAHRSGVIHRDIKPSNLFVTDDGTLKVLDFGVARVTSSNLTASGFLVGTPEYMSPEQPQGRPVDARSDIYSAASVFYFMLAGRSPFGSRDLLKMLDALLYEVPPPLSSDSAPDALQRVLMKALSKSAADRYQTFAEMQQDLEQVRRGFQGATYRIIQASRNRYRDILSVIEERRRLGRSLGHAQIDTACDGEIARLRRRFPAFDPQATAAMQGAQMDRSAAQAALEALQTRHNAERAALAALKEEAEKRAAAPAASESLGARIVGIWRSCWERISKPGAGPFA